MNSSATETGQFAAAATVSSYEQDCLQQPDISGLNRSVGVKRLTVFLELCPC